MRPAGSRTSTSTAAARLRARGALAALGITTAERQTLATLYAAGTELWRVPHTHFSPYDFNVGILPPPYAIPPTQPNPKKLGDPDACPSTLSGSIIECQNQALGESVGIVGTPYSLHYRSSRTAGPSASRTVRIQLSGPTLPAAPIISIELEIEVAGRKFTQSFVPAPNLSVDFTWDGNDAYGRPVQGNQLVKVRFGFGYAPSYMQPGPLPFSFAIPGQQGSFAIYDGPGVVLWQEWRSSFWKWDARGQGFAGWTLTPHHAYDPVAKTLRTGDGRERIAQQLPSTLTTIAGNGSFGTSGDGGPATQASIGIISGLALAPDGSVYLADTTQNVIRRVGTDGRITRFAGQYGQAGNTGDGGPATSARIYGPVGLAVAADGTLYFADQSAHVVRRIRPDGVIERVAGTGVSGTSGEGVAALSADLKAPTSVAVGRDGSLFIGDLSFRVRRVAPDGTIVTWAGIADQPGYSGDGGPAIQAKLNGVPAVATAPDGSLLVGDRFGYAVRRIDAAGIIRTVAGTPQQQGSTGDGDPALSATLGEVDGVARGPDGSFYIYDAQNRLVRGVAPDGYIRTIAGNGNTGFSADGTPARQAALRTSFSSLTGIAYGPDDRVYFVDSMNYRIRRIGSALPGIVVSDYLIPSEDGTQIYNFDSAGRHLKTLDALTGAAIHTFAYDASGRVVSITDVAGNVTVIERDGNGMPTAIVSPYGQRTTLAVDANGFLASVIDPAGNATAFTSTSAGLLTGLTTPRGHAYAFGFDAAARLVTDNDPAGGSWTLSRTELYNQSDPPNVWETGHMVLATSAMGLLRAYRVLQWTSGGEERIDTLPDGTESSRVHGSGFDSARRPDGTVENVLWGPDPRFGLMAPVPTSATTRLPSSQTRTTTTTRAATLATPGDPLSLTALSTTTAVNGRNYLSNYVAATRTFTDTTPASRQSTTTLDAQGRPIVATVAGLEPSAVTYDARGRIASIVAGQRRRRAHFALAYNAEGFLASITDPLGRVESFTYDAAGRVTTQTLPGGRVVQYAYDANGNLTSLTPPDDPRTRSPTRRST